MSKTNFPKTTAKLMKRISAFYKDEKEVKPIVIHNKKELDSVVENTLITNTKMFDAFKEAILGSEQHSFIDTIFGQLRDPDTAGNASNMIVSILVHQLMERVIFNELATVVYWTDGTVTKVSCRECEANTYSEEIGIAMAFAKKFLVSYDLERIDAKPTIANFIKDCDAEHYKIVGEKAKLNRHQLAQAKAKENLIMDVPEVDQINDETAEAAQTENKAEEN